MDMQPNHCTDSSTTDDDGIGGTSPQHQQLLSPPPPQPPSSHGAGSTGSIGLGSMANILMPEFCFATGDSGSTSSQQQQHDQQQQQLLWPPLLPPQGAGDTTSIGPGFMATRPTAAKTTLKCPKCESTNTKFCYYNNFSLNQPRYFCKTCRKYWTAWRSLIGSNTGGDDS